MPPSEEEQFAHYSALTFAMQPKPVTIRTIDFGGDKIPEWSNLPIDSLGSSIGIKGIRFSLVDERNLSIFKTHIRAILRASAHGPINIMFPMINDVEEFESALQAVHEEMAKLKASEFNPDIKIGTMIETPSAVTSVGSILEVADFASIGTNDLTEATLQVPRQHSLYGHAFNEAHPVVLGAIRKIADVGKEKGKPISVCGAMASNPFRVPLLLGAGIRQFSVSPSKAQEINGMIQICSTIECENLVDEMIKSQRPTVARKLFEQYLVELKDRAKQQT